MAKLSVIIPSRNEQFLIKTIDDLFAKTQGEMEAIAVLEGYWPEGWAEVTARHPNLHTIHHPEPKGLRGAINAGAASAISRGAKYLAKFDAHCMMDEGFDEKLKANCDKDWVVVPRRKRLDAENWTFTDTHKPDIDYHYLSFPDDPQDFGGPGLNGKVWLERALERKDIMVDDEMSSQGSGWFMHADYFQQLELMDAEHYGPFWNEMQEIGMKAWLSGGRLMVNKHTWYAHLHKGSKYGRGYKLPESWLKQGASFTKKWMFNEAWDKQTLPFSWLIEHFWPVPTWPEDWEERVYRNRPSMDFNTPKAVRFSTSLMSGGLEPQLQIHAATYGLGRGLGPEADLDVTERLQSLVKDGSLDVVVNNAALCPDQNPYRGKRKKLWVTYSINGGEQVTVERQEKEWLIIGTPVTSVKEGIVYKAYDESKTSTITTAAALNDYLIRKFRISDRRLRGPMPIELRDFHRDDLATLFAELGFTKGAEIGVAEGNYSEVLVKANRQLELLCVDPWHAYSANPQNKSKEKNEYAYSEAKRKLAGNKARLIMETSIDAVRDVDDGSLDFVYIDGNHSFDFVMFDLIAWSKKVRSGGIISGDDYYELDRKRWGAGPVEAVQTYTKAHEIGLWFICDAHRSVDFFWVKP